MLRVRYLPPEPKFWDCLREEPELIKGLTLWAITLFCLASLLTPEDSLFGFAVAQSATCAHGEDCPNDEALMTLRAEENVWILSMLGP